MNSTDQIKQNGFAIHPGILTMAECLGLIDALGAVHGAGRRGVLETPEILNLAKSKMLLDAVSPHVSGSPRPVRGIYFDKTADSNWLVSFHQDLTISVAGRVEAPGFGPWSAKDGMPHVQPPVELLEGMITLRLHLDDCNEQNGALRVLTGTHVRGRLSAEAIEGLRKSIPETICRANAGDALLMRPLLLHSSGRSQRTGHRRVLHLEYAGFELPGGLQWLQRTGY